MIRIVAIWFFGLFASGIIGGILGGRLNTPNGINDIFGFLAGMFAFACARLWLAAPRK